MQAAYKNIITDTHKELIDLEAMLEVVEEGAGRLRSKIALAKAKMAEVSTSAPKRGKGLSMQDRAKVIAKSERRFLRQLGKL